MSSRGGASMLAGSSGLYTRLIPRCSRRTSSLSLIDVAIGSKNCAFVSRVNSARNLAHEIDRVVRPMAQLSKYGGQRVKRR